MTEAEALENILAWSLDAPSWQRDAMRRIVTGGHVEDEGLDDLVSMCKGAKEGDPFAAGHLRSPAGDGFDVHLRQVHSAQHVNALAQDQRLTLHRAGLTIIYGDNGSGKSGYARILKKVCRARLPSRGEEIIPDIYEAAPGIPTATIEYEVGGQSRTWMWQLGQPADPALSAVSVFDARTANVHVDDTNDVAYTPFPLKFLATLAQLCRLVKDKLAAEIEQLKAQTPQSIKTPACGPSTGVGGLFARLASGTDPVTVEVLATLSSDELERLAQLTADLAGDPSRAARQLSTLKAKIDGQIAQLDGLHASVSTSNAAALHGLATSSEAARVAAAAASSALFANEPLPEIGDDAWRSLWQSARAYSKETAYPGQDFPVTEPGSVCVLCQQELTPDGANRLQRFETFIRNDSQQRAKVACAEYDAAKLMFTQATLTIPDLRNIVTTIRDELRQEALASDVRRSTIIAMWRHRRIRLDHAHRVDATDVPIPHFPRQALVERASELARRAEALTSEAGSPARAALVAEKAELDDRRWLGAVKDDVLAEIERLKVIEQLESAQRDTATNRITSKSTEIAQALVTDALRAKFAHEVAGFKISGLAVELRQQGSVHGVPRFKVALTRKPTATVGQVLSEGEHRCVALAAFLAELATTDDRSGIVFDDPVSSLDHMHRAAVATRLIAEAEHRQVIVFTHDLAFLLELNRAADESQPKPPVAISSVSRGSDKAGYCRNDPPFKARRVDDIIGSLTRQLANERYHYDHGDDDKWRDTVKSVATSLRDTWEIAVEEVVGHVIRRLSNKVQTPGLVKLTAIEVADCEVMRDGFQRCSELLHSSSPALNRPLPTPEALNAEINGLASWSTSLRQRQAAL